MFGFEKKIVIIFTTGILLGVTGFTYLPQIFNSSSESQVVAGDIEDTTEVRKTISRMWMEYTEDIVRAEMPTPPESARLYAYVATAYAEVLEETDSTAEASIVARNILNELVPSWSEATDTFLKTLIPSFSSIKLSESALSVEQELIARSESDGFSDVWDGARPTDEKYWKGTDPLTPQAKEWKQWVVPEEYDFEVPPPPEWGSDEHKRETAFVKKAAADRTPEQGASVNFWGGVPGTEAPAGIWQNVMFSQVRNSGLSDKEYAYAQMVLAQGIADAFIECWKVKYSYWTRRPSMDDPSILPLMGMQDPNFPSYVSGHSTVSRAAAEVLVALFPQKREFWIAEATDARDSRLWGGIHFQYDNMVGFELGKKVGSVVVEQLEVARLR